LSASSSRVSTSISPHWLTSLDINSRGRPRGRPWKARLSPRCIPGGSARRQRANDVRPGSCADNRFPGRKFHRERATPARMGGVLCRPLSRHRCRDQSRKHGVSDPGARAANGPARVRRGRSRHAAIVCAGRLSVCNRFRESLRIRYTFARGTERRSSRQSGPARAGNPGHKVTLVPSAITRPIRVHREHDRGTLVGTHQSNELHLVGGADHHAVDAGSGLGTVQGSSLRSARAYARPAGLDGACAQIGFGNYAMVGGVMTLSWTNFGR
jgi:hypothetical protein